MLYDATESPVLRSEQVDKLESIRDGVPVPPKKSERKIYVPVKPGPSFIDVWNVIKDVAYAVIDTPGAVAKGTVGTYNMVKSSVEKVRRTTHEPPAPPPPAVRNIKRIGKWATRGSMDKADTGRLKLKLPFIKEDAPPSPSPPTAHEKDMLRTARGMSAPTEQASSQGLDVTAVAASAATAAKAFKAATGTIVGAIQAAEEVGDKVGRALDESEKVARMGDVLVLVDGKWVPKSEADALSSTMPIKKATVPRSSSEGKEPESETAFSKELEVEVEVQNDSSRVVLTSPSTVETERPVESTTIEKKGASASGNENKKKSKSKSKTKAKAKAKAKAIPPKGSIETGEESGKENGQTASSVKVRRNKDSKYGPKKYW